MRTDPAPGSDPAPAEGERGADASDEEEPRQDRGRDAALRADRPPHWG